MTQLGFFVDVSKCSGCKTCAVACKDAHNLPVGMNFRKVHEYAGGNWKQAADGSWAQERHITNALRTVWWLSMRQSASAADFVLRPAHTMHRY